ncbi:MAG: FixH family protein [Robiginitomaculum sp.]|nr:FixH family protein [Robiginitomaculum sp.]
MAGQANHKTGRPFTGRHMLILMVSFFGVIVAVNVFMMYKAVTTFRGEDVKQSYRQGLDYNKTLSKRAKQMARGWSANININGHILSLRLQDENGLPVRGLKVEGVLKHPVETDLDTLLLFEFNTNTDHYVATLPMGVEGKRWVQTWANYANVQKGADALFETKNEIWLN